MALLQKKRLFPGSAAWQAERGGFRSVDEMQKRQQRLNQMGFRSVEAYQKFARAPKRNMHEYYAALAEARGQSVPQLLEDIRRAHLRKQIARLR